MKDAYIRIRLTTEEKAQADKAAKATNKTLSELIRFLLSGFIKKHSNGKSEQETGRA